ncbi:MAG: hypothetical protein FWE37_08065 [Spirochaetaceae bacterium]|nr:hypothetical protein [Spirochaetaceae bacterium]
MTDLYTILVDYVNDSADAFNEGKRQKNVEKYQQAADIVQKCLKEYNPLPDITLKRETQERRIIKLYLLIFQNGVDAYKALLKEDEAQKLFSIARNYALTVQKSIENDHELSGLYIQLETVAARKYKSSPPAKYDNGENSDTAAIVGAVAIGALAIGALAALLLGGKNK